MLNSYYTPLSKVQLPFKGRRHYMHTFDVENPTMLEGYEDYLPIVQTLLNDAGVKTGLAHMTVDEKIVKAGMSQRRPKPHVDGCFVPQALSWSHPSPGWLHTCNDIGRGPIQRMAVIVAASEIGCRVWQGVFEGEPTDKGDLTHISDQLGEGEILPAHQGYLLSPDCVHESMVMEKETARTFLRIALPT